MLTIVSTIIFKFLLLQVYYIRTDIIKKTLIVRHYEKCFLPILQVTNNVIHRQHKNTLRMNKTETYMKL